jgi:hypothetical protein
MWRIDEFEEMTADKRPQDPDHDGTGLRFVTLEHGGEYPDDMPQAIKLVDAEGRSCIYVPIMTDGRVVDSKGFMLIDDANALDAALLEIVRERLATSVVQEHPGAPTRDVDILIQVFVEIETILAELIQPGHQQNPAAAIEDIFRVMDRAEISAGLERLAQGYGELRVVK